MRGADVPRTITCDSRRVRRNSYDEQILESGMRVVLLSPYGARRGIATRERMDNLIKSRDKLYATNHLLSLAYRRSPACVVRLCLGAISMPEPSAHTTTALDCGATHDDRR